MFLSCDIAQGRHCQKVGGRSGVAGDAVREPERVGELVFESLHLRTHRDAGAEQYVHGSNDFLCTKGRLVQTYDRIPRIKTEAMVRAAIGLDVVVNCSHRLVVRGDPFGTRLGVNVGREQITHRSRPSNLTPDSVSDARHSLMYAIP